MNREVKLTIVILISAAVLLLGTLAVYTNIETKRLDDQITKSKINKVSLTSSRFELRMQYLTGIMKMTSQIPVIAEPPAHPELISEKMMGIPEDADVEKRAIAKNMLDSNLDFDYVFYTMPNGDIYFLEPYYSQLQLPRLNYAFRDWYMGAVSSGSTYVSEVYVSANTKYNVVAISVPLYDDAKNLRGIWVGTLDVGVLQNTLSAINLGKNEYVLIVDHNNNIVADSRKTLAGTEFQKISWNVKQTNGETKFTTQTIDGENMFITYKSIPIGSHQWQVMSIEPYADVFSSSTAFLSESAMGVASIVAIMSVAGFFMTRKINTNVQLAKKLGDANLELKNKAEQLSKIDVAKDEFSAMVTHELKTPLFPIMGYCKMFKNSMFGKLGDEQLSAIDSIEKNARGLEKLINDIMDARKLDINKMKFKFEDVSPASFFEDISSSYDKTLQERGIKFATKLDLKDVTINVDSSRLRQVFDNLIGNAIKFVPSQGGKIEIGGDKKDEDVILYVKDNGIGIPPEKQGELFKKFYQIDTSERRIPGGAGLGLAIARGIMENMNGSIWVQSDGKSGTTFYLRLPQK